MSRIAVDDVTIQKGLSSARHSVSFGTCIVGSDVAQPLLNTIRFGDVHGRRSNELAGMSVGELEHNEKCMLESAVCTDELDVDGTDLCLMVDAAGPAVCTDVDA